MLSFLFAEAPAAFGFDGAVGPNFDGEDEIARGAGVVEVAVAGEELAELLHQHFGDFDLGFALGGVGDDDAVFVAPRGYVALEYGVFEDGEGVSGFRSGAVHGFHSCVVTKHTVTEAG